MVGGVASHEFIQKSGCDIGRETRHETRARANKVGVDVVKAGGSHAPKRIGVNRRPGIVDIAERQTIVVGDVVVDADQLFAPSGGKRDRLGERRKSGIYAIGSGDQRLQRRTNCANRHRRGIRNVRAIWSRAKIGKISGALSGGWNVLTDGVRVLLSAPFLGPEEKGLLLLGIVVVRNVNRTTDGVTEIVLLIRRVGVARFAAGLPRFGVKEIIAQIFKSAAVEGTAAGLGLDFDGAGTVAAVLRAVGGGQDFKFGDRFEVGIDVQRGIAAIVHVVPAVEFPVVVLGAAAVHAKRDVAIDPDGAFVLVGLAHHTGR